MVQVLKPWPVDVEDSIADYLAKETETPHAAIFPISRFAEDLGLDSLDVVELLKAMEEKHGVNLASCDFRRVRSIHDLAAEIQRRKVS